MRPRPSPQLPLFKRLWVASQTRALAYSQALTGGILFSLDQLNVWLNNDTMKSYISELDLPKSITLGLVLLGIVTYLAHGHGDDA